MAHDFRCHAIPKISGPLAHRIENHRDSSGIGAAACLYHGFHLAYIQGAYIQYQGRGNTRHIPRLINGICHHRRRSHCQTGIGTVIYCDVIGYMMDQWIQFPDLVKVFS